MKSLIFAAAAMVAILFGCAVCSAQSVYYSDGTSVHGMDGNHLMDVDTLGVVRAMAVGDNRLYLAMQPPAIVSSTLDGDDLRMEVPNAAVCPTAQMTDIALSDGVVLWSLMECSEASILQQEGASWAIVRSDPRVFSMAVHGGNIFWTEGGDVHIWGSQDMGSVWMAPLGSEAAATLLVDHDACDVAVHGGTLFWSTCHGQIYSADAAMPVPELLIANPAGQVRIAVDSTHVYYDSGGTLRRALHDGTGMETVLHHGGRILFTIGAEEDAVIPPTGTEDIVRPTLAIFPNPAGDWITISEPFIIFDFLGRQLLSGPGGRVNIERLTPGVYLVRTPHDTGKFSKN